jgi:hypothetical protein
VLGPEGGTGTLLISWTTPLSAKQSGPTTSDVAVDVTRFLHCKSTWMSSPTVDIEPILPSVSRHFQDLANHGMVENVVEDCEVGQKVVQWSRCKSSKGSIVGAKSVKGPTVLCISNPLRRGSEQGSEFPLSSNDRGRCRGREAGAGQCYLGRRQNETLLIS